MWRGLAGEGCCMFAMAAVLSGLTCFGAGFAWSTLPWYAAVPVTVLLLPVLAVGLACAALAGDPSDDWPEYDDQDGITF